MSIIYWLLLKVCNSRIWTLCSGGRSACTLPKASSTPLLRKYMHLQSRKGNPTLRNTSLPTTFLKMASTPQCHVRRFRSSGTSLRLPPFGRQGPPTQSLSQLHPRLQRAFLIKYCPRLLQSNCSRRVRTPPLQSLGHSLKIKPKAYMDFKVKNMTLAGPLVRTKMVVERKKGQKVSQRS